jgi:outer membrane protein OmpA-like peptidoglycan-associated protein
MRGFIFKGLSLALLFLTGLFQAYSQDSSGAVRLSMKERGTYSLVERSDWSRYDNGKYSGHVYREVRASITPRTVRGGDSFLYRGNFFVLEETLRDMRQSARGVDTVVPVDFEISGNGTFKIEEDRGFPSLRGFPVFPAEAIRPGSKWTAPGDRAVDPLNEGEPVVIPFLAEYEYRGVEEYRGVPVYRIFAKYALRHQDGGRFREQNIDRTQDFTGFQGTHNVDILIRVSDSLPLMMRDILDEVFSWSNGSTLRFRGFTLTFGEGTVPLNRSVVIASLENDLSVKAPSSGSGPAGDSDSGKNPGNFHLDTGSEIDVATVSEGIRLTIKNLQFIPDSDELLPGEHSRLDTIARALKQIPDRTFFVEGHTAAVGRPAGEMELSIQRAKRMVDELAARGIPAASFIYKGWGGTKPLGDNANEAGRGRNRRVEITIME